MKLIIEKVAEGVKVTLSDHPSKRPTGFVIRPNQVDLIVTMIRAAMQSDAFRFEFQQ